MHIIIFRYHPKVINLDRIDHQNTIILAPSNQKTHYDALGLTENVIYLDEFILPRFFQLLRELQQSVTFSSITTLSEEDIDWVGLLADHFVNGNSHYASNAFFRDKYLMRSALIDIVNQPYFRLLESQTDLHLFWQNTEKDTAVIKPRFGAGSEKIIKIKRDQTAISANYFTGQYLIEEFLPFKNMLTCDGISIGEQLQAIFSHEYEHALLDSLVESKELIIRTNHLYHSQPQFLNTIFQACKHVLNTIAITDQLTPFHFEWFYDEDQRSFYFCEVGKRFGGAKTPKLIQSSFGVDILDLYWQNLYSPKKIVNDEMQFPTHISTTYSSYKQAGQLIDCPNADEFNWCEEININVAKLAFTQQAQSIMDSAFTARFICQNEDDYRHKLAKIRSLAHQFIYHNNKGE